MTSLEEFEKLQEKADLIAAEIEMLDEKERGTAALIEIAKQLYLLNAGVDRLIEATHRIADN